MNTLKHWLPLAAAITILSGLVYVTEQQNYRMSANDPQIQIAEDWAAAMSSNQKLTLPAAKIEMTRSSSPFMIILDDKNEVLYSSAFLDNKVVIPPAGVMEYTKLNGENRITWQPREDIRNAIVAVHYNNEINKKSGTVISGRSLKEVEKRIDDMTKQVALVWLVAILSTLALQFVFVKKLVHPHA